MFKSYSFFVHFCLKCEVWIMGQYFGMWKSSCSSTDLKKQLFLQLHCLFIYTKNQLTFWGVCISCLCWCFPGGASGKNLPANAGDTRDTSSIPGLRRLPEEGNSNPLQYSCLENPMERGAWGTTVHEVTKSQTLLK